jgi:hypothetical protein
MFRLTKDSSGSASLSTTELADFRTNFRGKRDLYPPFVLTHKVSMLLSNRAYLRAYMQQALDNMIYYRGDIKLSIQIGTPVLFQLLRLCIALTFRYPGRQTDFHEVEKFMRLMRDPKIQSELIR